MAPKTMAPKVVSQQVFISWSGELSRQVAELFKSWIGNVHQGIVPWISTDDIEKGSIWFGALGEQLAQTAVGVIWLTRENMKAPWILFEAGCLSKGLAASRVCPMLIDLETSDLEAPLSQFNVAKPTKGGMFALLEVINSQCAQSGAVALSEGKLKTTFDKWWDDFDGPFKKIVESHRPREEPGHRPVPDMVNEILEIVRSMQRKGQTDARWATLARAAAAHSSTWPAAAFSEFASGVVNLSHDGLVRGDDGRDYAVIDPRRSPVLIYADKGSQSAEVNDDPDSGKAEGET